jgi:hypothetical protein
VALIAPIPGIVTKMKTLRLLIEDLRAEWRALDERIAVFVICAGPAAPRSHAPAAKRANG